MQDFAPGASRSVATPLWGARRAESAPQAPAQGPNAQRHGSWAFEAAPGAYGAVVAWTSGAAWFDALMDALATEQGEHRRREARVAGGTLLRVARADWLAADADTGRGVATAHETVAAELGMSSKTVQRARALMEALGFAVTIVEGRYLTTAEREAARAAHGGHQVRAASLRALTVPKPAPVENVHLPRRGKALEISLDRENSPTRASARKSAAPRPPAMTKRHPRAGRPAHPRSLELQQFAARLVDGDERELAVARRRLPWLLDRAGRPDRPAHIGALCDVLSGAGIDPRRWTPRELIERIDRWHQSQGRASLVGTSRVPLAYFAWQLRQAIDPAAPTPAEEVEIRRAQRDAERAELAREREAERARMAVVDEAEVARIIAQMRAEMTAERRARRHRAAPSSDVGPMR